MRLRLSASGILGITALLAQLTCGACGGGASSNDGGQAASPPGTPPPGSSPGEGGAQTPAPPGGELPVPSSLAIDLEPAAPSATPRRVAFGVPLPPGLLTDASRVEVKSGGGKALASARRALATWPDGSVRSVAVQIELAVPAKTTIDVEVGKPATGGDLAPVPVEQTLAQPDGTTGPAVWAVLPADWLAASRVAGPALPAASAAGTPSAAWATLCDYTKFGTSAFLAVQNEQGSWLFDRGTALYRGYQRTGALDVLRSAYRETAIYRSRITGTGSATRLGVTGTGDDLKYHYAQALAVHYLLTGDDRFREAAENITVRAHDLWLDPGYAGGADFWTERHAGFALLAYEWAAAVSDDQRATFEGWADTAVKAYLQMQATFPAGYTNADERCFAHQAEAHGEGYGYVGCSPWMSAILADGMDTHADRLARAGNGAGAAAARASLVKLGRFVAAQGLAANKRPLYWAGVGNASDEPDEYDEHWGESAYLVALAWAWSGKSNAQLESVAKDLVAGFGANGEVGQLRSFNWQCRTSVVTPFYLRP